MVALWQFTKVEVKVNGKADEWIKREEKVKQNTHKHQGLPNHDQLLHAVLYVSVLQEWYL